MNLTPKEKAMKAKISKLDCVMLQNFCAAKETNKMRRQPTEWEKMFTNHISNKELISKICKELIKLNSKRKNNNAIKNLNGPFPKEDIQVANRYMEKWSTSQIIREVLIKTTVGCHLPPDRMAVIKKTRRNKSWYRRGEKRTLVHCR